MNSVFNQVTKGHLAIYSLTKNLKDVPPAEREVYTFVASINILSAMEVKFFATTIVSLEMFATEIFQFTFQFSTISLRLEGASYREPLVD